MNLCNSRSLTALIMVLVLFASVPVAANLADSFGFGAKHIGRSAAVNAVVNDWTSAYYNVAGMTSPFIEGSFKNKRTSLGFDADVQADAPAIPQAKKKQIESVSQLGIGFMYQASAMNIDLSGANNSAKEGAQIATNNLNFGAFYTGFIFDLRNIVNSPKDLPVALGASIALPSNGTIAAVNDVSGKAYNFVRLGEQVERFILNVGLSMQPIKDRLSVGVGFTGLAGGSGALQMKGVDIDPTSSVQRPEQNVKIALEPAGAPIAGIQYRQPLPGKMNIYGSLAYRGELFMEIDPLEAEATTTLLNVDLNMELSVLDFYTPHTFILGTGFDYQDMVVATVDVELQLWENYKVSSLRAIYDTKPVNFQNIFIPRLGGEAKLGRILKTAFFRKYDMRARGGYALVPALTPDQTSVYNYMDNTKHVVSLGSGITLPKNPLMKIATEINIGLQWQLWPTRSDKKSSGAKSKFNPNLSYGGNVFLGSLSAAWKF